MSLWFSAGEGNHDHHKSAPVGAVSRGEIRTNLKGKLKTTPPSELHKELLAAKESKHKDDLEAGNMDNTPSLTSLQKMASENNTDQDMDKDFMKDLILSAQALEEEYGKGSLFIISHTPFQVAWCTDNMARVMAGIDQKPLVGYIDCTGNGNYTFAIFSLKALRISCN